MIKVLYPMHLDRWTNPIASKHREIVNRNQDKNLCFYSFTSPLTKEDSIFSKELWTNIYLRQITKKDLFINSFDIIHHSSATYSNLLAVYIAKLKSLMKAVHIFTASTQIDRNNSFFKHFIFSIYNADYIIANSKAVADSIIKNFGKKIYDIIPNGVDEKFFSMERANSKILKDLDIKKPYVIFISGIWHRKRPDLFINLANFFPNISFIMVGTYTKYVIDLLKNAPQNVRYLGLVNKSTTRDLLAYSEALLFPSEIEGLPNAVLEAMVMGIPVIAQRKSSLPELIVEDKTGWLTRGDSIKDWENRLKEILNFSSNRRKLFSSQARSYTISNFSWDLYSKKHATIYRQLAKNL
ncbi:MAG: glycosyltransferase family 4 protein [Desulfobacterales bacterium]|nr:glycosyltransferase family 4 protein [Desulfobacterales bacterium]MBF0396883.1 glycosyltransferase family 4 protein [Desulfobacterales bacterium]